VPEPHRHFFAKALHKLGSDVNAMSVLVSGSADYLIPSLILDALSSVGKCPELTVVDICETPLLMNTWYATRLGAVIRVQHCDILDYDADPTIEVICTHHFFNYFPAEMRQHVIAKWRSLLRPDGRLILVNRYYKPDQVRSTGYSEDECAALVAAARNALSRRCDDFPFSDAEVEEMVRQYGARIRVHALDTPQELLDLLKNGGFAIEASTFFSERRAGNDGARAETAEAIGVVARRL
jgi:SAM-dependent methyltransferase